MREFYGYTPVVNLCVNICPISCYDDGQTVCICGCLQPTGSVPVGDCYYPNYTWSLFGGGGFSPVEAYVCIKCNGATIYQCCVASKSFNCLGSWTTTARKVDYNDLIHIITYAEVFGFGDSASATISVASITQCVGTMCRGATYSQTANAGDIAPE
jgi:hypothetical protein